MLPKAERLTKDDIKLLSNGKSVFGTLVSIRFLLADADLVGIKFSVSVSKKVASRAVDRNRIRRRVYSSIRLAGLNKLKSPKGQFFVMVMPKKECLTAQINAISTELQTLIKKATI